MRVIAPGTAGVGSGRRGAPGGVGGDGGGFAALLDGEGAGTAPARVGTGGGPRPPVLLGAMLAPLAAPAVEERRRRALRRGHDLLDGLEALRLALLLDGGIPPALVRGLRAGLAAGAGLGQAEAGAGAVLAAIELRVAVELAKVEAAADPG